MYYNIKNNIEYYTLPTNAYNNDKCLVQNLPLADAITKADCGYYTIRNDSPVQPPNTIEDVQNRVITLDKPYIDIVRQWIPIIE